jgi:sphingosine kinase
VRIRCHSYGLLIFPDWHGFDPYAETSHSGHAREIARELPLDAFDAVLCLSGDGLLHEVVNGFQDHAEPARALRVPLAPIPTGSGNATCLNLLGLKVRDSSLRER